MSEEKTKIVQARCTSREAQQLAEIARQLRRSSSDALRWSIAVAHKKIVEQQQEVKYAI